MSEFEKFQFFDEEGRQEIYRWSERRRQKFEGFGRYIYSLRLFAFDRGLLKSFVCNINVIVIIQMALAGLTTFICQYTGLNFEVHPTLFVSPLIFPLAFSINTDFQRREKVLEDLANFKASAMVYFFCLRDWRESADFDENFIKAASNKLKSLLFHLREYLMTEKVFQRSFILQVIYEDCSDLAQIIERVRLSKLPANSPLISRLTHLLNMLCFSFERLRVVREYRSPRSIRSFTKIFIFGLPLLLSPYYVYIGAKNQNLWSPYFIAVLVSFVFGTLQGVQDKLDDPFDGMSEDDIDLARLDDWTVQSLEATANRTFKIGRFTVLVKGEGKVEVSHPPPGVVGAAAAVQAAASNKVESRRTGSFTSDQSKMQQWQRRQLSQIYSDDDESLRSGDMDLHPYAGVLSKLPGNATILRGGHVKEYRSMSSMDKLDDSIQSGDLTGKFSWSGYSNFTTPNSSVQRSQTAGKKKVSFNQVLFGGDDAQITIRNVTTGTEITPVVGSMPESSVDPPASLKNLFKNVPNQHGNAMYSGNGQEFMPSGLQGTPRTEFSGLPPMNQGEDQSELLPQSGIGVASYINANRRNLQKQAIPRNSSDSQLREQHEQMYRNSSVPINLWEMKSRVKVNGPEPEKLRNRFAVSKTSSDAASDCSEGSPKLQRELLRASSTAQLVDSVGASTEAELEPRTQSVDSKRYARKSRFHRRTGSDSSLVRRASDDSIAPIGGRLKDNEVFI